MTNKTIPPFFPQFGTGAPGVGLSTVGLYYDTSTTPYTEYIFHAGAWHVTGTNSAGNNATSIQGIPVDAASPSLNQVLQYDGTKYTPTLISGGAGVVYNYVNPNAPFTQTLPDDCGYVIFTGPTDFSNSTFILPANPSDGQVIFFVSQFSSFGTNTIIPNTGQTASLTTLSIPGYNTRKYTLATTNWDVCPNSAQ